MPVVCIPDMFLDPTRTVPSWSEVQVQASSPAAVVEELLRRFPPLARRYTTADGQPSKVWFSLFRDEDGTDIRSEPGRVIGEGERLHLINLIGC